MKTAIISDIHGNLRALRAVDRMAKLWRIIRDDIRIAIESIGDERLRWLRALPDRWSSSDVAVVHASPDDKWNAPGADAPDDVFAASCAGLGASMLVYGHIHVPFIRCGPAFTVANAGSVGLPYDGDPRAAFLVMEDGQPSIPRVAYDVEREIRDRVEMAYPHANWIAGILRSASFQPATDR